ncbi:hypothetical protein [Actinokineospora enzanensis]|uniref:hypothetical protein n=1 Tax=Actinokineospora enzanensis TaxID=155975 RepID=UPI0003673816|nr:hypothetical protein [Actinokineospora enzanensis]
MPTFDEWQNLRDHPQPGYPEYDDLRAETRAVFGPFVSPQEVAEGDRVIRDRDLQWCRAVLGWEVTSDQVRRLSTVETRMLILAARRDLDPPLPKIIRGWQDEAEQHRVQQEQRRQELTAADQQHWETALATCQVAVEVRPNTGGRRYRALDSEPLRHAVPLVDAVSGTGQRPRRHRSGAPLCETASRAKPRVLGDPEQAPATCENCLTHTATLRPATEEQQ